MLSAVRPCLLGLNGFTFVWVTKLRLCFFNSTTQGTRNTTRHEFKPCFGINSAENRDFSLCLIEVLTGWEVKQALESILCPPSSLSLNVLPRAISQPSPTPAIVLGNEQSRGRWKNMSGWKGCIFPTTQRSSGTIAEVGTFPPTAGDRPGMKVADWWGGKVARGYIPPSSVCVMMLKGWLPALLTRIGITDELNSTAHLKETHYRWLLTS